MKLEIENLQKSFNGHTILKDFNLFIPDCKSMAILGPSGSGKSTLLKLLAGVEYPDHGSISIDDQKLIFEESFLRAYRLQNGIVFQTWNLFPHLTALDNISLPLYRVHGLTKQAAEEKAFELLKRFELQNHAYKKPAQLSGGQCQRVAVIRAIALRPKIVFLDEPTSALDPLMTVEVLDLISELNQSGTNLILVTHHVTFAQKISDWIVFLNESNAVASAPAEQFFVDPPDVAKFYLDKVLKY